jgi:hypothetical protein
MLPIFPPFCAGRFASPLWLAHHLEACFSLPPELAVLHMQTPRQRKVAAACENKRPQLFGGFVFMASAFFQKKALPKRCDILECD